MTRTHETTLPLIGRVDEQEQLARAMASSRPELIAVHGRRRIGKTYLVRSYFAKELCFEMTGVSGLARAHQLRMRAAEGGRCPRPRRTTAIPVSPAVQALPRCPRKRQNSDRPAGTTLANCQRRVDELEKPKKRPPRNARIAAANSSLIPGCASASATAPDQPA